MNTGPNFRPNPNFVQQLQREAEFQKELRSQALEVKRTAEVLAPKKTGYYIRHLNVAKDVVGWRIESQDPFGHLVEWGSINNRPYAPLRRAARAAGLRFVADSKIE